MRNTQSGVASLAVCTERRALDCARMKRASRALVCQRRDGRTDGIPAALLCSLKHAHRTMFQHLHPTQHAHCRTHTYTHVKKLLLPKNIYIFMLPINLKHDTHIVNGTHKEEETEKNLFDGRRKTEGRGGYSDIERQRQRQRALQHLGISYPSLLAHGAEEEQKQILHSTCHSGPPL